MAGEYCYIGIVKTRLTVYLVSLLLTVLSMRGLVSDLPSHENYNAKCNVLEVLAEDPPPVSEIELVESGNGTVPGFNAQEKWGAGLIHFNITDFRYCCHNNPNKRSAESLPQRYLQHIYPSHFFW